MTAATEVRGRSSVGQRLAREVLIALLLIAVGLIGLPAMVFVVGQRIVGDYEAGLPGLYAALANGLAAPHGFAWLMVLSPYLCIQLIRVWFWLRRLGKNVN